MYDIIGYPDPVLAAPALAVSSFDLELKRLVRDMAETMYGSSGVGLAAPQVNVNRRVMIIDPSAGEDSNQMLTLINPSVTWRSVETAVGEEGCLSLPGVFLQVSRSLAVEIEYYDVNGNRRLETFNDITARIVQHEHDHLDGIVMLDRVGSLARKLAMKALGGTK